MIGDGWRRGIAVALSVLFLAGTAGEVYGLHDCPHHHPEPAAPSGTATGASSDGPAPKGEPLGSSSDGPCTCVGTCHAAAAAPTTALDRETPVVPEGEDRRIRRARPPVLAPPHDASVLLPYPTGPPAPNG